MFIFRLCSPGSRSLLSTFVTLGLIPGLLSSLDFIFFTDDDNVFNNDCDDFNLLT